jgi:hypothetical protein
MNIVICVIAKNENRYIKNFCDYHLSLGFDHIYIFDNNDIPEIHNVIQNSSKITVQPFKTNIYTQKILYNTFIKNYDYDWCAFIDVDEFITLNQHKDIHDFINTFDDSVGGIKLFEQVYGDDNLIYPVDINIPVYNRIKTISTKYPKYFCKMFIRKNKKAMCLNAHYFYIDKYKTVFCDNTVEPNLDKLHYKSDEIIDSVAYIRHYRTKTCSEFCEQKLGLTRVSCTNYTKSKDYYFMTNEYTEEKDKFIDEYMKSHGL